MTLEEALAENERLRLAIAAMKERCAQVAEERGVLYRKKAERHSMFAEDTVTEHERFIFGAEASEHTAYAIRNLPDTNGDVT